MIAGHGVNTEGLTFEEWITAAGMALFKDGEVVIETTSYRRRIVDAWKNGEDPTETRAAFQMANTFSTEDFIR